MSVVAYSEPQAEEAKQQALLRQEKYTNFIRFVKDDLWPYLKDQGYASDELEQKVKTFLETSTMVTFPVFEVNVIKVLQDHDKLGLADRATLLLGNNTVLIKTLDQVFKDHAVKVGSEHIAHLAQPHSQDDVYALMNQMERMLHDYFKERQSDSNNSFIYALIRTFSKEPVEGQAGTLSYTIKSVVDRLHTAAFCPEHDRPFTEIPSSEFQAIRSLYILIRTIRYLAFFMTACSK